MTDADFAHADFPYTPPTRGAGLANAEAERIYAVLADLSEATLDPWVCADLANFVSAFVRGDATPETEYDRMRRTVSAYWPEAGGQASMALFRKAQERCVNDLMSPIARLGGGVQGR